ncbi:MAG: alpha/beta fold hydrolase [Rhodospirillales bacterium]
MPFVETDGERIAYVKEGTGPALAFIHSLGTGLYLYRDQIDALKDRYTCIAYDTRGHGDSTCNGGQWTVAKAAADLKAVLDACGVKQAHILGLSMGGPIALAFYDKHPQMVRSMIIADSFAEQNIGGQDRIKGMETALGKTTMKDFGAWYADDRLLKTTSRAAHDDLAAAIAKIDKAHYLATVRSVFTDDLSPVLPKITVPTKVLIGDQDKSTPMPMSEKIRDAVKGATLEVIPNAGHLANLDNPAGFTTTVAKFLDAQPR